MSRLIDADAFDATMYEAWMNCEITNEEWFHFREMIKDEPTVEPKKMRGRWEYLDYGGVGNYHCSACRRICVNKGDYDFCPFCGADMREMK